MKEMRSKTKQIVIITVACLAVAGLALSCSSLNELPVGPEPKAQKTATPLQLSGLSITPAEAAAYEQIFITADARNSGAVDDVYGAQLKINNSTEFSNKVTIPAGQTRTLTFAVSKGKPGVYKVTLGNLTGQFVVAEAIAATGPDNQTSVTSAPTTGSSCCGGSNQTSAAIGQASGGCCGIGKQTSPAIGQTSGGCCGTGAQSNPVTPRRSGSCCGGG